jgi:preprotein translocase subunit YajC
MLISAAYAQETAAPAAGAGGPDLITSLLPLVLIFVVFYFLMIRPQQKKMKEHRGMVANLRRGDRVVTGGGFVGVVSRVINDGEIQVEIAEGVRVRVLRHTITQVLGKGEPVKGETKAESASDAKS